MASSYTLSKCEYSYVNPVFSQLTGCCIKCCSYGDVNVRSTLAIERRIQRQKLTEAKRRKRESVLAQADLGGQELRQDQPDSADDDSAEGTTSEIETDIHQYDRTAAEEDCGFHNAVVVDEA